MGVLSASAEETRGFLWLPRNGRKGLMTGIYSHSRGFILATDNGEPKVDRGIGVPETVADGETK